MLDRSFILLSAKLYAFHKRGPEAFQGLLVDKLHESFSLSRRRLATVFGWRRLLLPPQEEIKDTYFKIALTHSKFESHDTLPTNFSDNETTPPFHIP